VQCGLRIAPGRLSAGGFPMSELANGLSALVQRPVIDRTGLTGTYDAEMTFSMEAIAGPPGLAGAPPPSDPNLPSLFTAVQEQLGLKLESTRGPVQMLVIDRVEPPIED
jgi:uncharacterized protein (TIGR03435 family)